MAQTLAGRIAIRARQIHPGEAFAARVPAGGLVEIVDLEGKQVAELVAFSDRNPAERLSLGVTRRKIGGFMLQPGGELYSSRGNAMLRLVEDSVGRHDLLWAAPTSELPTEPAPATVETESSSDNDDSESGEPSADTGDGADGGTTAAPAGFAAALAPFGLDSADAPDPVNFFMQVAVMQKGNLELREPLSERSDRVMLEALDDLIVAVRCSSATDETNGKSPSDLLVRVYR